MASSSMCVTTLSGGEASALPPDSGVAKGAGAASRWVIMASVAVVCATDADLPAGADFSVDLKMPPHITPLKISPRLFPTATVSHHFPEVLAADASGLLLLHADQGPAAGPIFVDLPGRSEAKPSAFLPGYFVLDANNSTSFSIPNAENFMDSDKVGLITSPDGGPYVVAELQHAIGRSKVTILEYKSVDGTWAEHTFDNPVRDRRLAPHGSFPHNGSIWWVDLSVGLIVWDPAHHHVLKVLPLPAGKELPENMESWRALQRNRCVAVSAGKIRFAEMIYDHSSVNRPQVALWCLRDLEVGEWDKEYCISFSDVQNSHGYKAARLPPTIPSLALVNPDDPCILYFHFEKKMFSVDLRTLELLGCEDNELMAAPSAYLAGRYVRSWKLPAGAVQEDRSTTNVTSDPSKLDDNNNDFFAPNADPFKEYVKDPNKLTAAMETDCSYSHANQIKEYLKDPSKFAAAVPSGGAAAAPEEEKEESDGQSDGEGMGLSQFDD